MLKVAVVSAVYPPEPVVSAQLGRDLAMHLAKNGAQVTVLCPFPTRPMSAYYSAYKDRSGVVVEREGGVEVVRLPSFTAPESRLFNRIRESWSFGKSCCHYLSTLSVAPDVLYVNTWPLLGQALIARYAKKKGIPMVLQIVDIYPESLFNRLPDAMRFLTEYPLRILDGWIARQASRLCVISENMRKAYITTRNVSEARIVTIPTWQDEKIFETPVDRETVCARYGVRQDRFTFLFLGNISPTAVVDFLIRAFHKASIKGAQLLIAGDGSAKEACVKLAEQLKAVHIQFIPCSEACNVPLLQSMAHVCLLSLKRGAGNNAMPSKLSAYMLSGKPILATVDENSDAASAIREAECGWVGEPENAEWLARKMVEVAALPAEALNRMGANGWKYGMKHFSKTQGVKRLADLVTCSAGSSGGRAC